MKNSLWITSRSTLGIWSFALIPIMVALFILGTSMTIYLYKKLPASKTILEDIMASPTLTFSMLSGMAAGIATFFTGLLIITLRKEYALFVYISTAIGALVILFLAGEVLFPQ